MSQVKDKDKLEDTNGIKKCRIIADHLRCACLVIGDEISTTPSNKGRGYVLRKILRRAINCADQLEIEFDAYEMIIDEIINMYKKDNYYLESKRSFIIDEIHSEYFLYKNSIKQNLIKIKNELKNMEHITNEEIKTLYDRYGVPIDIIKDVVEENQILVRRKV